MRKIFLISMLAMLCSITVWGKDAHVSNITDLKAAVADASVETIYLDADINNYKGTATGSEIRILRSVTIDGQGHTIKGYGKRTSSVGNVFSINQGGSSMVDVVFRNINMIINFPATSNDRLARVIETRGNIRSIELDNVTMGVEDETKTIAVGLQLGGSQASKANITITNSTISVGKSGYPVLSWNPYIMTASNSTFSGYCGLYFKGVNSSAGSAGTIVNADACNFDAPNAHAYADGWNNFGVFTTEDANITLNLHNCGMNAQEVGLANQGMILAEASGCVVNISGDNSHINGHFTLEDSSYPGYWLAFFALTGDLTISGGTYSEDPSHYGPFNLYKWFGDQDPTLPNEDMYANFVAEGDTVQEVKQGDVTLYRVVKKAATKEVEIEDPENPGQTITVEVLYDLNDNVQGVDSGNNPVTSFDLCTGDTMQLNKETTTAGYVQVSDNITYNTETGKNDTVATTIQVGKVENEGTAQEEKVDQTLVINNGLDVQGDSKVEVQAGSALVIGEGGINTEKPENIVIEADEEGAASLLLHPDITVNQTPELTVKMTAKQIGKVGADYFWHRFAMPVDAISSLPKDPSVTTKIFGWDYETDDWKSLSALSDLKPFYGYTLTTTADRQDVTYTFQGHLVGNLNTALNFTSEGYNFFGNSYTGYIDIVALADQLLDHADIDAAIWVWNTDQQNYHVVTLGALKETPSLFPKWKREIAPMQTFILRLATPGVSTASTVVDYNSAIWSNPRYSNDKNNAPARKNAFEGNAIRMSVAANGMNDEVLFIEKANFSDEFDKGYDGTKYMNTEAINIYSTVNNENYSAVATDQIEGKMLTIETVNDVNYTISFDVVLGETEYALRDNATNKVIAIEEGASYEFAAQPNSTVEGRFEIVDRANVVTSIDNAQDNKANVKGIYTIMGQYVGENFDVLPTGVYVVDGVKIVK